MQSQDLVERARNTNILTLASRHTTLKRVAATHGGEFAGPCPLCGGQDRFHVQQETNRWFCRRCTGDPQADGWQDAIELQMRLSGETFPQAVASLAQGYFPAASQPSRPISDSDKAGSPPGELWQKRGRAVIARGMEHLWGRAGGIPIPWQETDPESGEVRARKISPRNWLQERGLEPAVLQRAQIGFIPQAWHDNPAHWGLQETPVHLAAGILIPAQVGETLWSLKIRRTAGKPKYTQVRGGQPALYLAETLLSAPEAACIVEGEFDALLLWQCLQHAANPRWQKLGVITLGSNANYPTLKQWARYLYPIKHFLLLYDQDGRSDRVIRFWQGLSSRTRQVTWRNLRPNDKDLTDYHCAGGRLLDLVSWAVMQIEYETLAQPPAGPSSLIYDLAKLPPETGALEPLPATAALPAAATMPPQRQARILSIEEAARYIQGQHLHIKSVTWPAGTPHPIMELE